MARYYFPTDKNSFLKEVKALMEHKDFPTNLTPIIAKDLGKVTFDWENYSSYDAKEGLASYPHGYEEIKKGIHVFYCSAGGKAELPVCFIFYWGDHGQLRAYIPRNGNCWDKEEKVAYIKHDAPKGIYEKEFNLDQIRKDILSRIHPPA